MKLFLNMRRYQGGMILAGIVIISILGMLLLFGLGLSNAMQIDTPDCEQQTRSDCFPREETPTCPNPDPTQRCPMDAAE